MQRRQGLGALVAAIVALGCASPEAAAPPIDECERGLTWAECPGALASADPVLACDETYGESCYWFTGGLVADGFVPRRPGAPGCQYDAATATRLARTDHLDVEVVLAPPTTGETSITCVDDTAAIDGALCRPGQHLFSASTRATPSVIGTLFDNNELYGTEMSVEVIEDDAGVPRARVCYFPFTDVAPGFCPATRTRACAVSGTVTLEALPPTPSVQFPMDVHATFESGLVVDMHLL